MNNKYIKNQPKVSNPEVDKIVSFPSSDQIDTKTKAQRRKELGAIVTINDLLNFQLKTENGKIGIVKRNIERLQSKLNGEAQEQGGDYHIRAVSAMKNAQLNSNPFIVSQKIETLQADITPSTLPITRKRWQSNIATLNEYKKVSWAPNYTMNPKTFIAPGKGKVNVNGLEISLRPELLYRIKHDGEYYVGALKFIVKPNRSMFKDKFNELISYLNYLYAESMCGEGEKAGFCFAVDVYGNQCIQTPKDLEFAKSNLTKLVSEYFDIWESQM